MKKLSYGLASIFLASTLSFAATSKDQCNAKGEDFIFAGGECIQYAISEGEVEGALNIIVHGTWKSGTNTLGRYAPFAETLSMNSDITSIAVALPGYSKSSTNNIKDLNHGGNSVYTKKYIEFTKELVKALKQRYEAKTVNYIGHSAGGTLGANVVALNPELLDTVTVAGGRFNLDNQKDKTGLISINEYINNPTKTKFLVVYGTADKISKPEVTTNFYKLAKDKGLDIQMVKVEGAPHIDLDMTDESVEAITELISTEE